MRVFMVLAVAMLAACATEQLATAPPAGVDLSGHWQLDEPDSDDPMRLVQAQLANATANAGPAGSTGRGGQRGGAQQGLPSAGRYAGPVMPSVTTLDEALRWPPTDLTITQGSGTITFIAHGKNDVCRPSSASASPHQHQSADDSHRPEPSTQGRGVVPPPVCGWDQKTLVVRSGDDEEERAPFERRFSMSDDAQELIELVRFTGGPSHGFTASRVWKRAPAGTAPTPASRPQSLEDKRK